MSSEEILKDNQESPKAVESNSDKKVPMTDEERILLCQKMDKELDDFINSLERKRYTEGWSEDTWQEEMEKHPFFMKTTPDNEMSPLAEGLANLKYDPAENTPNELANNYKEDGNFNYKHKNYRLAILGYTEGIKVRCPDGKINAALYNNRAAAHFHLKNYRSALQDCEKALNYDPVYTKCRMKAANCAYHFKQYDKTIKHCAKILEEEGHDKEFLDSVLQLHCDAKDKKKIQDRDERRRLKQEREQNTKDEAVLKAVADRKIRVVDCWCNWSENDLEKLFPEAEGGYKHSHSRTYMVSHDNGVLYWPVRLLYPEYDVTDLIKDAPENVSLITQLQEVFREPPLWDQDTKYNCLSVNVYFTGWKNKPHLVDINGTLREILQMEFFELRSGTPEFYVIHKGSQAEKTFLKEFD